MTYLGKKTRIIKMSDFKREKDKDGFVRFSCTHKASMNRKQARMHFIEAH